MSDKFHDTWGHVDVWGEEALFYSWWQVAVRVICILTLWWRFTRPGDFPLGSLPLMIVHVVFLLGGGLV